MPKHLDKHTRWRLYQKHSSAVCNPIVEDGRQIINMCHSVGMSLARVSRFFIKTEHAGVLEVCATLLNGDQKGQWQPECLHRVEKTVSRQISF